MVASHTYADLGRMYGECILYWMIENAVDIHEVDDMEILEGSGLTDLQFKIGFDWLVEKQFLQRSNAKTILH